MMNCNRYRNYNTGRSGCRNEGCGGSFTEYIPVTVNYEVVFGNGFVGGDGINSGNGVSPANTGDCFYTPATNPVAIPLLLGTVSDPFPPFRRVHKIKTSFFSPKQRGGE